MTGTAIDCRSVADPCEVIATQPQVAGSRVARGPLHFDPAAPLLPAPTITVAPSTDIADGTSAEVDGTGFTPGRG